ncbi:MAG: dihydrofolate reductase family protein, partial [Ginsengibacter sp.]
SIEDQEYYRQVWKDAQVIVMGSNTYMAEKFPASQDHLLLVMTQHVSKYRNYKVEGQIEFTNATPEEITKQFEKRGFEIMTVVGGAHIATSFFKEQLIDELWLTIEPKIFGTGGNFVIDEKLDIDLRLISCDRVNERGTLINKYAVIKKSNDQDRK